MARKTATVGQVAACVKCDRWNKAKIQAMFGQRESITLNDLLADKRVKWYDKVWVAGYVFFHANPFECFKSLKGIYSLSGYRFQVRNVSIYHRRKIYSEIRRKAREAGIM